MLQTKTKAAEMLAAISAWVCSHGKVFADTASSAMEALEESSISVTAYGEYVLGSADFLDDLGTFAGAALFILQCIGWLVVIVGLGMFAFSYQKEEPQDMITATNLFIIGAVMATFGNILKLMQFIY